ncbi:phosphate ABC transporter permease subunit PstC [Mucilaginibacter aquariorum]|uniref:Phosphate transport system permease protein n=1 Tax=Mucilaginibacter aquariorum TaxID=2967225 RepID=A0ABT1T482_9SPHI|nr:phosphate ABC transporter permease subunit PstC [Mucilaginibacter aquariorum]MCQ6958748.1 phosphate ABC transporter permease subunit PstC [Mucilaginibacter aquariorum]
MKLVSRKHTEKFTARFFKACGFGAGSVLIALSLMLVWNAAAFFIHVKPYDFVSKTQWDPTGSPSAYGMLSMLISTMLVAVGAMLIAIPLGIGTAAFLAEYAGRKLKNMLKPAIEMLAAIPSVAIGFLGIVVISPGLAGLTGRSNGLNALNGAILLSVMALPTIITVAQDAIDGIPISYKEASFGIGASRWQTLTQVTIPAAAPGILAAIMLGVGRAIGETMTVLMATGNAIALPHGFFDAVRTMTATIAIEMGEVPFQTTHYYALFSVAILLFIITLVINMIGEYFVGRFKKFEIR